MERIRTGQFYSFDGEQFLLSQIDAGVVAMISLVDGNRYNDPVSVDDATNISRDDLTLICAGDPFVKMSENDLRLVRLTHFNS